MPRYQLWVNGERRDADAPEGIPLLWLLRDYLGLLGTKFGCGRGLCGACTVHVDGNAGALLPGRRRHGRRSPGHHDRGTRRRGAASHGARLHPCQQAWIEEDVPQCGYCQAGQIMTAAALLARNPRPDDAAIDAAMIGNLCRCGTYVLVRRAIHRAAAAGTRSAPAAAAGPADGGGR